MEKVSKAQRKFNETVRTYCHEIISNLESLACALDDIDKGDNDLIKVSTIEITSSHAYCGITLFIVVGDELDSKKISMVPSLEALSNDNNN